MDPWVTKKNALQGHHYLVAVPLSTGLGTRLVACSLAPQGTYSMKVMLTAFLDHSRPDLFICQESLLFHQEKQKKNDKMHLKLRMHL